jgi:hypothetical protein
MTVGCGVSETASVGIRGPPLIRRREFVTRDSVSVNADACEAVAVWMSGRKLAAKTAAAKITMTMAISSFHYTLSVARRNVLAEHFAPMALPGSELAVTRPPSYLPTRLHMPIGNSTADFGWGDVRHEKSLGDLPAGATGCR